MRNISLVLVLFLFLMICAVVGGKDNNPAMPANISLSAVSSLVPYDDWTPEGANASLLAEIDFTSSVDGIEVRYGTYEGKNIVVSARNISDETIRFRIATTFLNASGTPAVEALDCPAFIEEFALLPHTENYVAYPIPLSEIEIEKIISEVKASN